MKYQVLVDGKVVKEYEHRLQAVDWCFINGYAYEGEGHKWFLGAEIREVEDSLEKCEGDL